jgi:hypothetical protein
MKKLTQKFYYNAWYAIIALYLVLHYFFFQEEAKIVEEAMWVNPWYSLTTIIFISLLIYCLSMYSYLTGKKSKGVKMKAVIHIRGGNVEAVYTDDNDMKVLIIDHDVEGTEDKTQEYYMEGEFVHCKPINITEVNKKHVKDIYEQITI